jgi:PmbA protein
MISTNTCAFSVKPGELENVEEIGKHVEIISMHGSHTSNPTTGDFGMEVNIAFINGKPVRGFIMSGNIFDLLNNVIGLEKKQTRYANILAPKIAFSEVDLIG